MKNLHENLHALVGILTVVMSTIVATNKGNAGTYVVNVPAGDSTIANNLNTFVAGGNTIDNLFNSSTSPNLPGGTSIFVFDCSIGNFTQADYDEFSLTWGGRGA